MSGMALYGARTDTSDTWGFFRVAPFGILWQYGAASQVLMSAQSTAARTPPASGTILVVDDVAANLRLLDRLLSAEGYSVVTAADGQEALDAVAREHPDLVLMDVRMPRLDGIEACGRLKRDVSTRLVPVVLMTGFTEPEDRIRAIDAGADDFLAKPIDQPELKARVRSLIRLKRYTDDLDSAEAVILSLALTIEARDPYTDGHCQRLAAYAVALGRRVGLSEDDLTTLHRGGYLHDIGKIGVSDVILRKRGRLTAEEFETVKQHTVIGDRLCTNLRFLTRVRPVVRHHHERLDGSGYPDGLRGDAIPLVAQIMGVVDVYDALTTVRPYKDAWPIADALAELRDQVVRGWRRADLVESFAAAVDAGDVPPPPARGTTPA
jgi:cyclic di-GMP phosphodiesterase